MELSQRRERDLGVSTADLSVIAAIGLLRSGASGRMVLTVENGEVLFPMFVRCESAQRRGRRLGSEVIIR
jgi:hypothetical protein